ncbi:MAG: hypothetical protein MI922_27955, partial [Bacteroidales bacterium]|nr:hypothetical protein [Bacteroidales bacterium]
MKSTYTAIFLCLIGIFVAGQSKISANTDVVANYYSSEAKVSSVWLNDSDWTNGKSPGVSIPDSEVHCWGHLTSYNCLDMNKGVIYIHDTLIVNGDFSLGNKVRLYLDSTAVLIIYGNYSSGNKVEVVNHGIFI